jgi:DNA-binding LacI/PurR family transcriptional regulator
MKALYERGLSVPDYISIIGYDNIRESEYLPCPLTTISPPIERMVKLGVNILHNKIIDKTFNDIQHISLKPELIIRNSTAPIK